MPGSDSSDRQPYRLIGVDPGGAQTGLVVADCQTGRLPVLLDHLLVERGKRDQMLYHEEIVSWISQFRCRVSIEDLNPPTGHLGMINVRGLLDTAALIAVLRWNFPHRSQLVNPSHIATGQLGYPQALIGKREGPKLTGKLRHCRSAWDVVLTTMTERPP